MLYIKLRQKIQMNNNCSSYVLNKRISITNFLEINRCCSCFTSYDTCQKEKKKKSLHTKASLQTKIPLGTKFLSTFLSDFFRAKNFIPRFFRIRCGEIHDEINFARCSFRWNACSNIRDRTPWLCCSHPRTFSDDEAFYEQNDVKARI